MNDMKGSRTHTRDSCPLTRELGRFRGKFSPDDAAFDGAVSGARRLGIRNGSLHPGDMGVPNRRVSFREAQ